MQTEKMMAPIFSPIFSLPHDSHLVSEIAKPASHSAQATPWWPIFKDAVKKLNYELEAEIFPAATDSRYVREVGIPAFGFSAMSGCPVLLHEHNEYLPVETFYEGIGVYVSLLRDLAEAEGV